MTHSLTKAHQEALSALATAKQHLDEIPEGKHLLEELLSLEQRIAQRQKTIAVFGAFSAGKSSLINALIGDNVLVVSPNPTTATVSHIFPRDDQAKGRVYAKSQREMWDDVQQALLGMHKNLESLEEAVHMAGQLSLAELSANARRAGSFLKAVAKGYDDMRNRLGTEWEIDVDDIETYTADERHACYLRRVDIPHHSGFLGENGIVLVDTPGVDSIHRRHTDVAFQYMRQADAIVFVLYYTHAFSRADKDFLMQLAGVQDVAGKNKLFVVINAVDLATSDDERAAVRDRVYQELRAAGIRQPRVYELSAQVAFAAAQLKANPAQPQYEQVIRQRLRLSNEQPLPNLDELLNWSGLPDFVRDLSQYVHTTADDLIVSSVSRLMLGMKRQIAHVLEAKRQQAGADAEARKRQIERQLAFRTELTEREEKVQSGDFEGERALRAEWDELIFHIGERIRVRLGGLFREAYHPGRFRPGTNPRIALQEAAEELATVIGKQIDLEARTFALRAQSQLETALGRHLESMQEELAGLSAMPLDTLVSPVELVERFSPFQAHLPATLFASGVKYFRNAKQFFEEGGERQMLTHLEPDLVNAVKHETRRLLDPFIDAAVTEYRRQLKDFIQLADRSVQTATEEMQHGVSEEALVRLNEAYRWVSEQTKMWQETEGNQI